MKFANITTKRVPVKVERECQCVSCLGVYDIASHTDEETGQTHMLLWTDVEDGMAIGFRFYGYVDTLDGYSLMAFDHIDPMPDKRTAMQAWLNLTKED